jgi:hypothetical protein
MSAFLLVGQQPVPPSFFDGPIGVMIFFGAIALAATIFWLWMLIDALMSNMETDEKILWFLVIFFLHFIGALIYLFARKKTPARTRANQ